VTATYSPSAETFTTGSSFAYYDDAIYIQKEATGRWFAYILANADMRPWGTTLYPQGAAIVGNKAFQAVYIDGATRIPYIHLILNSLTINQRQMVI
jgi:hypothetical protein